MFMSTTYCMCKSSDEVVIGGKCIASESYKFFFFLIEREMMIALYQ
jgi:hypothetical protein